MHFNISQDLRKRSLHDNERRPECFYWENISKIFPDLELQPKMTYSYNRLTLADNILKDFFH